MTDTTEKTIPTKAWVLLIILSGIWGGSFFFMAKGLEAFSAPQVASLRLSIAFVAFLPIFIYRIKEIPWKKAHFLLIVGGLGSATPALLFAFAQTELTSSITGVLGSTTPLFTLLLGILLFRIPFVKERMVGILVGLAGAILIVLLADTKVRGDNPLFALLPIIATLCYGLSTNTVKSKLNDIHPLTISATAFVLVGPLMLGILFSSDFIHVMQTHEQAWESFSYIFVLGLLGTFLGSILFFTLIQLTSAVFASTVAYLLPLVATVIGFVSGEPITLIHLLGLGLILAGVYLSRR